VRVLHFPLSVLIPSLNSYSLMILSWTLYDLETDNVVI
jgi:hypothetical protein